MKEYKITESMTSEDIEVVRKILGINKTTIGNNANSVLNPIKGDVYIYNEEVNNLTNHVDEYGLIVMTALRTHAFVYDDSNQWVKKLANA